MFTDVYVCVSCASPKVRSKSKNDTALLFSPFMETYTQETTINKTKLHEKTGLVFFLVKVSTHATVVRVSS